VKLIWKQVLRIYNILSNMGGQMPYINVKVAGALSENQKKEISRRFSEALYEVANKKPQSTYIVFEEIEKSNWAVGDRLLSENSN